jgi:hypothetical protein
MLKGIRALTIRVIDPLLRQPLCDRIQADRWHMHIPGKEGENRLIPVTSSKMPRAPLA